MSLKVRCQQFVFCQWEKSS